MQFFSQKSFESKYSVSNSLKKVYIVLLIIFSIISLSFFPNKAHAGIFSFLTDIVGGEASAETNDSSTTQDKSISNSQKMEVLEAVINSEPNPIKSIDDEPKMLNNTLIAQIGPSGTVSDIEESEKNGQISLYIVREGDTLSNIAEMFDVTVNTIIWANDLNKNTVLKKDQKLIILPISGIKYTVKKGDTIKSIVSKYKTDLTEVLQFNDLAMSSVLKVGDTIIIPDAEPGEESYKSSLIAKNSKVNTSIIDSSGPFYPGYYNRPIDGGYKSQALHGHNGVDIAAPIGTSIHASAEGTVIASMTGGWNGGYGNYVVIAHPNGTQTLYAHNQKNFVKVGDRVEQGQTIAKLGSTGRSTGPHIHFEIRGAKNPF